MKRWLCCLIAFANLTHDVSIFVISESETLLSTCIYNTISEPEHLHTIMMYNNSHADTACLHAYGTDGGSTGVVCIIIVTIHIVKDDHE